MHRNLAQSAFQIFDLPATLLKDINRIGWIQPTTIQEQSIPPAIEGRDVIAGAQTGTGKTGCFAIPILRRLAGGRGLRALVLAPTRELAVQIQSTFEELGRESKLVTVAVYGGVSIEPQLEAMRRHPDVLVATPGRLIDLLQRHAVSLKTLKVLVLDEADRMLDMGFMPQIRRIFASCPRERQTMLFSATIPQGLERLVYDQLHNPVKVSIGLRTAPADRADQRVVMCDNFLKQQVLLQILADEDGTVLVFTRTRIRAERLGRTLRTMGYHAARLHSSRTQAQRESALDGFRSGRYRILVATDIAARGIDVANIAHVVNFDVPQCADDYVHRVGRTARAEASGKATTIISPFEIDDLKTIEKAIGRPIAKFQADGTPIEEPKPAPPPPPFGRRPKGLSARERMRR
ncbi:MAG: DEAD/DEAH box helicase [Candidatus Eisenbacteria bacterium]|nr:DEAD/DEAH box helicase [Candidatus Eisenbacteria bacterium]